MRRSFGSAVVLAAMAMMMVGCPTVPQTDEGKQQLHDAVTRALDTMYKTVPDFRQAIDEAYAYAVFPSVGEGALLIGGGRGRGEVFQGQRMIGNSQVNFGSVGLQVGGQEYSEVILFENKDALDHFAQGKFEFDAKASAVILKDGVAYKPRYTNGIAMVVHVKGGAMAQAALGVQKFSFVAAEYAGGK